MIPSSQPFVWRILARGIANTPVACSFCICVVTLIAWIHSHKFVDSLVYSSRVGDQHQTVIIGNASFGVFTIVIMRYQFPQNERDRFIEGLGRGSPSLKWAESDYKQMEPETVAEDRSGPSFGLDQGPLQPASGVAHLGGAWYNLTFPCWLLLLISVPIPLLRFWKHGLRRLRRNRGMCQQCGYDLRASPDRCPECGE